MRAAGALAMKPMPQRLAIPPPAAISMMKNSVEAMRVIRVIVISTSVAAIVVML